MPSLPIPMIAALLLGFLLVALLRRDGRHGFLAALLGACALQGVVISLAQHYQIAPFRLIQPVTAATIPPLAWVSFQATAVRGIKWGQDAVHLIGPAFALFCLFAAPYALDVIIPGLFIGYGIAMLIVLSKGADTLPRMRLSEGDMPTRVWRFIGGGRIISALSDGLIVAAQIAGLASWQPWIISIVSTGMLMLIGALTLSDSLSEPDMDSTPEPEPDTARDAEIMTKLDALMDSQRLYLTPDLTLSQLARRLTVPAKQLSAAINRKTGANVSRYINARRIGVACAALKEGENVTSAMLSAGFNTKSNFNREFLRVVGKSPSDWLRDQPIAKTPHAS